MRVQHLLASLEDAEYTEPRCATCTSEYRWFIEGMLAKRVPYERIAKRVPADERGRKVDRRSISNHRRNHMPR